MYAILVYDVSGNKVTKVCHFLRQYLNWTQNSAFEGDITISQLKEIEIKLNELIDQSTDCVQIYTFRSKKAMKKKTIGTPKAKHETVI